ncbi:hypothetical protein ACIBCA_08875 [Kitasatospora sp. NPDC051170]|uniref:hypothetical protein n=1 Tax=Kitasatospora sp. NPDC051170 TaxID=3364056 RepID=UPI0037AF0575
MEPDEHVRFARYRAEFAAVEPQDAPGLVVRVLTDPDGAMANSAVCGYLDRRGAELLTEPGFPDWHGQMAGPVATDAFSARRLREWALMRAVELGEPWRSEDLLAASNWCQSYIVETSSAPAALAELAEGGRTRRVRDIAKDRLR